MSILELVFIGLIGLLIYEYVPKKSKPMATRVVEAVSKVKKPATRKESCCKEVI
jgi:uncharacterized membrane protein YobD (UPF0266 family)